MISVLLLGVSPRTFHPVPPGDVVRTLAALVPATVEGVVRDVCLLASRDSSALAHVADHAGCTFVEADSFAVAVDGGAKQARCPTVLVAQAGLMLDRSFIDEIAGLMPTMATDRPHSYRLKAEAEGFLGRLFPALAPDAALLTSRDRLLHCRARTFGHLVQLLQPKRRLHSKAWLVE